MKFAPFLYMCTTKIHGSTVGLQLLCTVGKVPLVRYNNFKCLNLNYGVLGCPLDDGDENNPWRFCSTYKKNVSITEIKTRKNK